MRLSDEREKQVPWCDAKTAFPSAASSKSAHTQLSRFRSDYQRQNCRSNSCEVLRKGKRRDQGRFPTCRSRFYFARRRPIPWKGKRRIPWSERRQIRWIGRATDCRSCPRLPLPRLERVDPPPTCSSMTPNRRVALLWKWCLWVLRIKDH